MPYREARNIRRPNKNLLNNRPEIIYQCCIDLNNYRLKTLASSMKPVDIT